MLGAHQAVSKQALQTAESGATPQHPNCKVHAEVIEALLYACSTWTLRQKHYVELRIMHCRILFGTIGAQRKKSDHWMASYNRGIEITGCRTIETLVRTRSLLWVRALIRTSGVRLTKRTV